MSWVELANRPDHTEDSVPATGRRCGALLYSFAILVQLSWVPKLTQRSCFHFGSLNHQKLHVEFHLISVKTILRVYFDRSAK